MSDPQSMKQIEEMMSALNLGTGETRPPPAPPPVPQEQGNQDVNAETIKALTRFAPLLSSLNREDNSTRLLMALRPLLSAQRQKKLDEALKILKIMRIMPLLRDEGLFSGLLSGLM